MQLCSKPRGGTRNRTRDLPKKGSAFITSSDHWTLCRGITRQVLATVPMRARLNGHIVVALQLAIAGLPISTDDLMRVAGGPSYLPLSAGNADARLDCGLP